MIHYYSEKEINCIVFGNIKSSYKKYWRPDSGARLPEWSKGVDSSSTVQEYSWVQIPQRAFFFSFVSSSY